MLQWIMSPINNVHYIKLNTISKTPLPAFPRYILIYMKKKERKGIKFYMINEYPFIKRILKWKK